MRMKDTICIVEGGRTQEYTSLLNRAYSKQRGTSHFCAILSHFHHPVEYEMYRLSGFIFIQ